MVTEEHHWESTRSMFMTIIFTLQCFLALLILLWVALRRNDAVTAALFLLLFSLWPIAAIGWRVISAYDPIYRGGT
jgi:hypothetical protein